MRPRRNRETLSAPMAVTACASTPSAATRQAETRSENEESTGAKLARGVNMSRGRRAPAWGDASKYAKMHLLWVMTAHALLIDARTIEKTTDLSKCDYLKRTPFLMNLFTEELRVLAVDDDSSEQLYLGNWFHNSATNSDVNTESLRKLPPKKQRGYVLIQDAEDLGDSLCDYTYAGVDEELTKPKPAATGDFTWLQTYLYSTGLYYAADRDHNMAFQKLRATDRLRDGTHVGTRAAKFEVRSAQPAVIHRYTYTNGDENAFANNEEEDDWYEDDDDRADRCAAPCMRTV